MTEFLESILLVENPDAILVTTTEGRIVHWSNGAKAMFLYDKTETLGRLMDDLIVPPEQIAEAEKILRETVESGFSTYESIRRRKDGSLVYVAISGKTVRDKQGEVFVLSTKKDVTHLKVLRDAKLVEARFGNLLESTPDGIIMANATGRIVLANSQAEKLFGYKRGEMRGQLVETLLPARYRRSHVGHRSNYFAQPRARAMGAGLELNGLRKDGMEFPVEISLSPLETDEGTLVISAVRDITERKRFERALHDKNIELQNAASAKNRFLANMSHELRTPLNGIIGFAEFLSDGKPGPLNDRQKEYLGDILNSGRHLLQLINDVLDLAKVEAGKMELKPDTFSLRASLDEVCAVIKPLAQRKGIQVTARVAAELPPVTLDQQKFKQVLYNLLANAVKFTDDRGRVEIDVQPAPDQRFAMTVKDNGIGIKPEDFHRLFTEFEQLESGHARRYEGTGLGLALTRKLTELQGGVITVQSEVGHGSAFTVTFPLAIPPEHP
ncbi:MAG TPA: PAS domain S-box protein [Verrucomicrobiae bacterium]|jgi:PAS domain S-box-containing protein|nr:PAS domain S-box protein [Verrucomicrobiae bacterium]